jgi:O-antigen ligase
MPAGPDATSPSPALDLSTEPPAAPRKRERLLLGALLLGFLALLGRTEAAALAPYPLALVVSGILVFALLCVTKLEAAFLLVLAVVPFSRELVVAGTGNALQMPTEPMLFVALAAWGARSLVRRSHTFAQPGLMAALLLVLLGMLVSMGVSAYRFASLKATLNAAWYALFGLFLANNLADRGRLKWLGWAVLVPGVAIAFYSMANVLLGNYVPLRGYWSAGPFFTEHGTYSGYLSFACVLAMALSIEMAGPLKLLFALVALFTGSQVVLSMTRGAWVGLAGFGLFLLVVSGRRLLRPSNAAVVVVGLLAVAGLIAGSGAGRRLEYRAATISDPTFIANLERLNRWGAGLSMFRAAPLTGVGFGAYSEAYLSYRKVPLGTEQSRDRMGVHSEYLRILAETGLIGALTTLLAMLAVARVAWRAIRNARDPYLRGLSVGLAGGLVTYAIHGIVNNYMAYDKLAIPVWMAVGTLAAVDTLNRR